MAVQLLALFVLASIIQLHHFVEAVVPARMALITAFEFSEELTNLYQEYISKIKELCADDESCLIKALPDMKDNGDFISLLEKLFEIIREFEPGHSDKLQKYKIALNKFDAWDSETGKGHQAMSTIENPVLGAIKEALKFFKR